MSPSYHHPGSIQVRPSRKLNHRINRNHERSFRLVYKDIKSTFNELLLKDGSFIKRLAIELCKVVSSVPKIMNLADPLKENRV